MGSISDLDPTTPLELDSVGAGNEAIQEIKLALKTDFGAIAGPVYEDADVLGAGGTVAVTDVTMSSWEARIKAAQLGAAVAAGAFDGRNTPTQLSGFGFTSIVRTATVLVGAWDVTLAPPIIVDDNMLPFISGPTFANLSASYTIFRVDDQTLRVVCSYIPDGTEVVNTFIDSTFSISVLDVTI